jgi:hypothetical protein
MLVTQELPILAGLVCKPPVDSVCFTALCQELNVILETLSWGLLQASLCVQCTHGDTRDTRDSFPDEKTEAHRGEIFFCC